ncbi:MAG: thioesterase family protein [Bacteroidia bacterium]|nr:thioesterase family protein [Bacteroidia bacterium]
MNGTTLKIRGYHCDAYGHVNNARYLELLEEARWTFLEPALKEKFLDARNLLFVVVNINISYKKPLFPEQVVDIEITDVTYKNKSMVVRQIISDKHTKELASEAMVTFVLLNSKSGKPETITPDIVAKFDELTEMRND